MGLLSGKALAIFALVSFAPWLVVSLPAQERSHQERNSSAGASELVGRYELVSGEKDGQAIPAARLKGSTLRIAANAMTTFDKDEKEVYVATYDVDTSSKPWRITMTAKVTPDKSEGSQASGLIEKSGDTVQLVYALPGEKTPTEFKTGEKQHLFVLKKIGN